MSVYAKVCIICQKKFYAKKVNKIYCSKACSNRTRYMPADLVASLVQRNSTFTIRANKYVASVLDDIGNQSDIGYIPDGASKSNPLGKDEALLLAHARELKEQRDRDERDRQKSLESLSGFGSTAQDPEMLAMMHTLKEDEIPEIKDISIETEQQPKKYRIKKFKPNGE